MEEEDHPRLLHPLEVLGPHLLPLHLVWGALLPLPLHLAWGALLPLPRHQARVDLDHPLPLPLV